MTGGHLRANELGRLSDVVIGLANRQAVSISDAISMVEMKFSSDSPTKSVVQYAIAEKQVRMKRNEILGTSIFRDPAWDMTLDLFIADHYGEAMPVTSLCVGSGVAMTTALRHVERLVQQGFAIKRDDPHDNRLTLVSLNPRKRSAIELLLGEFIASKYGALEKKSRGKIEKIRGNASGASVHPVFAK